MSHPAARRSGACAILKHKSEKARPGDLNRAALTRRQQDGLISLGSPQSIRRRMPDPAHA
ncbi:MAG TPA: hypothetical protein VGH49_14645 [Xanthobacteraceae bacterium]|jgi:hypothetical protein